MSSLSPLRNLWRAHKRWFIAAVFVAALFPTCSYFKLERTTWWEDVKFSDGQIVRLSRTMYQDRLGLAARPVRGESLSFLFEDHDYEWEGDLVPVALERVAGKLYLVANVRYRGYCTKYGDPDSPYVYYRYEQGWTRITAEDLPEVVDINLLRNYPRYFVHVKLSEKNELNWTAYVIGHRASFGGIQGRKLKTSGHVEFCPMNPPIGKQP